MTTLTAAHRDTARGSIWADLGQVPGLVNRALAVARRPRAIELHAQAWTSEDITRKLCYTNRGTVCHIVSDEPAILAEVVPQHTRDTRLHALARDAVRSLLESPTTELVDVSTAVARKAGELQVRHGVKTWDAVHLATANLADVDVVIVRDHKFPKGHYEGVYVTGPFDIDEDKLFTP